MNTTTDERQELDTAVDKAARAVRALTDSRMRDLREGNATSAPDGERGTAVKGTQIPLDAVTVDLIDEISDYARALLSGSTGVPVLRTTPAEGALSAWVPMMKGHAADGGYGVEELTEWTGKLRGFAKRIDSLIDPPRRIEITAPCPACNATRAKPKPADGETEASTLVAVALTAFVRPGDRVDPGLRVVCGACDEQWEGEEAIRAMAA